MVIGSLDGAVAAVVGTIGVVVASFGAAVVVAFVFGCVVAFVVGCVVGFVAVPCLALPVSSLFSASAFFLLAATLSLFSANAASSPSFTVGIKLLFACSSKYPFEQEVDGIRSDTRRVARVLTLFLITCHFPHWKLKNAF